MEQNHGDNNNGSNNRYMRQNLLKESNVPNATNTPNTFLDQKISNMDAHTFQRLPPGNCNINIPQQIPKNPNPNQPYYSVHNQNLNHRNPQFTMNTPYIENNGGIQAYGHTQYSGYNLGSQHGTQNYTQGQHYSGNLYGSNVPTPMNEPCGRMTPNDMHFTDSKLGYQGKGVFYNYNPSTQISPGYQERGVSYNNQNPYSSQIQSSAMSSAPINMHAPGVRCYQNMGPNGNGPYGNYMQDARNSMDPQYTDPSMYNSGARMMHKVPMYNHSIQSTPHHIQQKMIQHGGIESTYYGMARKDDLRNSRDYNPSNNVFSSPHTHVAHKVPPSQNPAHIERSDIYRKTFGPVSSSRDDRQVAYMGTPADSKYLKRPVETEFRVPGNYNATAAHTSSVQRLQGSECKFANSSAIPSGQSDMNPRPPCNGLMGNEIPANPPFGPNDIAFTQRSSPTRFDTAPQGVRTAGGSRISAMSKPYKHDGFFQTYKIHRISIDESRAENFKNRILTLRHIYDSVKAYSFSDDEYKKEIVEKIFESALDNVWYLEFEKVKAMLDLLSEKAYEISKKEKENAERSMAEKNLKIDNATVGMESFDELIDKIIAAKQANPNEKIDLRNVF